MQYGRLLVLPGWVLVVFNSRRRTDYANQMRARRRAKVL